MPECGVEGRNLRGRHCSGWHLGMKLCLVANLIGYPVAHPGREALVKQRALDASLALPEPRGKVVEGGELVQWVEAQERHRRLGRRESELPI